MHGERAEHLQCHSRLFLSVIFEPYLIVVSNDSPIFIEPEWIFHGEFIGWHVISGDE
jgi:hypothetical protein